MSRKTKEDYLDSVRRLNLESFMFGERVTSVLDHPIGKPAANSVAATYELAQFYIDTKVAKYMELRVLTHLLRGEPLGSAGPVTHVFEEEFGQRRQDFAMQLQGQYSPLMRGPNTLLSKEGGN